MYLQILGILTFNSLLDQTKITKTNVNYIGSAVLVQGLKKDLN